MFIVHGKCTDRLYDPIMGRFYKDNRPIDLLTYKSVSMYINSSVETKDEGREYLRNHTQIINAIHYEDQHKPNPQKVKLLDITLGMKCNYRCKYCLQNDIRDNIKFNEEEFVFQIKQSGLNLNNVHTIRIWGGEPFVYWKRFVSLVELLRQRLRFKGKIWTVSNGSLFNQDKCSFCLENRVAVMFSHDGEAQTKLRDSRDFLDDLNIREAVKRQLQAGTKYTDYRTNFSVSGGILMVLGPCNIDINSSIDLLERKLFKNFPSKIATVFKADKRSEDVLKLYGEKGIEVLKQNLLKGLRLEEGQEYYSYYYNLRRLRDTVIRHLIYALPIASFKGRCPSYLSAERLAFDTEGRILVCYADSPEAKHNHGKIAILEDCSWNLNSIHTRKICQDCPYVAVCMGGCPILDGENHKIRCQSQMPITQALFESAYEKIFNEKVLYVEKL